METLNKTENKLSFNAEMENVIANAIRRYVHQIPVVAIDDVEIARNDSALYDETVAHRLGLVPLKAKKQSGEMTLKVKKEGYVYSGEMQGDAQVVFDKIPLTLLGKGQELDIKVTLKAGTGSEHSKFVPGLMHFRNEAEVTMDKKFKDEIKGILPNADVKESGNKITVLDNQTKEILDVCEGVAQRVGETAEVKEKGNVIISIESFGQLKVEEIFTKSIEVLKKDLAEFAKLK